MRRVPPPFHPVVHLPDETVVLDLGGPTPPTPPSPWSIGRYGELRPGLYDGDTFEGRCLHVGLDLGGPVGTPVYAFDRGTVLHLGCCDGPGDYGPTLVTAHEVGGAPLYALFGHLSTASLHRWRVGDRFGRGVVLGWLGAPGENGGWPPHVHLQLSRTAPETHDLPGVVSPGDSDALERYPDPALVVGDQISGRRVVRAPAARRSLD